jgi:hypothetical protein
MTTLNVTNKIVGMAGVKQGSSALPAFDLRGSKGKAGKALALPLRNLVNVCTVPAEAGRTGVVGVKQGSSALPAFDLCGSKGKAGDALALPLQKRTIGRADPAEAGRAGYEF